MHRPATAPPTPALCRVCRHPLDRRAITGTGTCTDQRHRYGVARSGRWGCHPIGTGSQAASARTLVRSIHNGGFRKFISYSAFKLCPVRAGNLHITPYTQPLFPLNPQKCIAAKPADGLSGSFSAGRFKRQHDTALDRNPQWIASQAADCARLVGRISQLIGCAPPCCPRPAPLGVPMLGISNRCDMARRDRQASASHTLIWNGPIRYNRSLLCPAPPARRMQLHPVSCSKVPIFAKKTRPRPAAAPNPPSRRLAHSAEKRPRISPWLGHTSAGQRLSTTPTISQAPPPYGQNQPWLIAPSQETYRAKRPETGQPQLHAPFFFFFDQLVNDRAAVIWLIQLRYLYSVGTTPTTAKKARKWAGSFPPFRQQSVPTPSGSAGASFKSIARPHYAVMVSAVACGRRHHRGGCSVLVAMCHATPD